MARDASKLTVFTGAHEVALQIYQLTADMPASETFGLRSQLRRAAISVPTNIVEGCARSSTRDYLRFLEIAAGSASELRYLLAVGRELELLPAAQADACRDHADKVIRSLQKLRTSVERSPSKAQAVSLRAAEAGHRDGGSGDPGIRQSGMAPLSLR